MSDQYAFPASALRSRPMGRSAKAIMPTKSRQTFYRKLGKVDSASLGLDSKGSSVLARHCYDAGCTSLRLARRQGGNVELIT